MKRNDRFPHVMERQADTSANFVLPTISAFLAGFGILHLATYPEQPVWVAAQSAILFALSVAGVYCFFRIRREAAQEDRTLTSMVSDLPTHTSEAFADPDVVTGVASISRGVFVNPALGEVAVFENGKMHLFAAPHVEAVTGMAEHGARRVFLHGPGPLRGGLAVPGPMDIALDVVNALDAAKGDCRKPKSTKVVSLDEARAA